MRLPPLTAYPAAWTICPMRFLLAFSQGGVLSPLLPLLRETFQVSHSELGLLISMFGLSRVLMDVIAAYLLRHRSLINILFIGITITGIGSLLCALAPGFYWLVGARVFIGFGVALSTLAALTVIVEATPLTAQGRANNLLEFSAIAGSALSPTVSGLTASLIHWRATFLVSTLFVAGALAWVILTRRVLETVIHGAPAPQKPEGDGVLSPVRMAANAHSRVPRTAPTLIAYSAAFILSFTWAGFLSTALPLYGGEVLRVPTQTLGMIFTAGLLVDLVLLLPVGWLSDRLDPRFMLTPAMLLMAAGLAWLPNTHSLEALLLLSIVLHTSFAAWGMPSAALALLARGEHLGRVLGVYRFLVDGAVVIAPWLIGTLIGRYSYGVPAWLTAGMVVLTAVVVARGMRP